MLTFTKINHSLYNASQNFENLLVFQVTSKLLVEWGGGIILLCSLCLEYLGNEKCLRVDFFCHLTILPLIFLQEKVCWKKQILFTPK